MLSVRAKIATEFVQDFDLLIAANREILTSYNQKSLDARQKEECSKKETKKSKQKNKKGNKKAENIDNEEEEDEYKRSMEPLQAGSMSSGDFNFGQRTIQTFERASVYMINNHPNFINPESTLLRSTSFDLLFLLSTQESIHRLLQSYKEAGEEKEVSFAWLLEYYNNSLEKYFDGNQSFGRADDWFDELLLTPPSLKNIDGNLGFIDPLSILEDIIAIREKVAEEWKSLISLTPHEQESLRQAVFVKQMEKWGHKSTVKDTAASGQATKKVEVEVEVEVEVAVEKEEEEEEEEITAEAEDEKISEDEEDDEEEDDEEEEESLSHAEFVKQMEEKWANTVKETGILDQATKEEEQHKEVEVIGEDEEEEEEEEEESAVFVKEIKKWGHTVKETGILDKASKKEELSKKEGEEKKEHVVELEVFGEFE